MEWVATIILLMLISFIFYTTIPIKTTKTLFIPKGSVGSIITHLSKKGYMLSPIDKYILVLLGKPQSGWISMENRTLNRIDFLHKLVTAKAHLQPITLIPGETTHIFFKEIAKKFHLNSIKLQQQTYLLSPYKEAGIYADTYSIPLNINEKNLIAFLVNQTNKKYEKISKKIYGSYKTKQWNRILTIASIIQKEAANNQEMPLVSSVIYNRLKKNMRLQMDGTLNYGKYSHTKITPHRIKNDTSHFNTYKYRGLPPYPICAVSIDAIKSAIKPAKTDYLYFMKNSKGVHDFSTTYKKHREFIKDAKSLQK